MADLKQQEVFFCFFSSLRVTLSFQAFGAGSGTLKTAAGDVGAHSETDSGTARPRHVKPAELTSLRDFTGLCCPE